MFSCQFLICIAGIKQSRKTKLFRFWPKEGVLFLYKMIIYVVSFPLWLIFASIFFWMSIFSISPICYRLFASIYFQNQDLFYLRKKPCSETSNLKQSRNRWTKQITKGNNIKSLLKKIVLRYCKKINRSLHLNKSTARTFRDKYRKNLKSKSIDLFSAKRNSALKRGRSLMLEYLDEKLKTFLLAFHKKRRYH